MKKQVVIVSGGTLTDSFIPFIKSADLLIGVDRGAQWLLSHRIIPQLAVGDFDSVSKAELANMKRTVSEVVEHPAEKDWTDTELAAREAIARGATEVTILGAIGTRVDHTLGNLHVLDLLETRGIAAAIVDERNHIQVKGRGRTILERGAYKYVSILPFTKTVTVSLEGLLYPLSREQLVQGQTRGISNELVGHKGVVTIHAGKAIIIQSRD